MRKQLLKRHYIHVLLLFLDGAYVYRGTRPPWFQRVRVPDKSELEDLVQLISQRESRCQERLGLLVKAVSHPVHGELLIYQ